MPYLRDSEIDTLKLPSAPDTYWVRMKKRARYGDFLAAQGELLRVSQGQNGNAGQLQTDIEISAFLSTLTVRLITEWNLDDQNGNPLPVGLETLALLETEDGQFLAQEAQARLGQRSEERQAPFEKPSGLVSTGTTSKTRKPSG